MRTKSYFKKNHCLLNRVNRNLKLEGKEKEKNLASRDKESQSIFFKLINSVKED